MSKTYHCSYCGMKLEWTRKSLINKATIVDLIAPHECDERHVENITDAKVPIHGEPPVASDEQPEPDERRSSLLDPTRDLRSGKDIKSTAPKGALDQVEQSSKKE